MRTLCVIIRGYTIISLDIVFELNGHADSGLILVMLNILYTVKTLYYVTRYNRIFNIQHKFAGNGSVSIKTPYL